ncbi:DNA recombination/repair protein RecA [Paenibacillus xylanexedens]|uniref:DNA recombination/repair protein RecA n=1 Tax=Paenibacillus xylanexedens TaxID=528191 RepID=UPI00119C9803|nr:DNA recombination/repair protein RecA [Paenibacillus xylanexedens]
MSEETQIVTEAQTARLALLNQFRKEFGPQSMFLLGQDEKLSNIEVRSSGSLLLDLALGGGYPKGRIIEFSGPEGAGKTTLFDLAVAEAQIVEPEKENAIIDLEQSFSPPWARTLGVDIDRLFIAQPDTYAEKIFDLLESMIKSNRFAYIGLDSVAGLVLKSEFEEQDWEKESRVGGASKVLAKAMRKLVNSGILTKSGTTLIFINQLRDKIGGFSMYGTPTDTTGGRSIKHAYSQRIEVGRGEYKKKGTDVIGQQTKLKVAKNKIAAPHKTANLDLYYEDGVDRLTELVLVAKEINVLAGGGWLTFQNPLTGEIFEQYGKEGRFNGAPKTREALVEDIEAGGTLYAHMMEVVQTVIRS